MTTPPHEDPAAVSIASLRRQVAIMEGLRDSLLSEPEDQYLRWVDALEELTGDLVTELHMAESEATGRTPNPWHGLHGTRPLWPVGLEMPA